MPLADPLVVCREVLLSSPGVLAITDQVYATPFLPPGHTYPLIWLSHIGTTGHAPVGFRHSATATVQMSVWAHSQEECAVLAEAALDAIQGVPPDGLGALYVSVSFESSDLDETAQPALYRRRADLQVRIAQPVPEVIP